MRLFDSSLKPPPSQEQNWYFQVVPRSRDGGGKGRVNTKQRGGKMGDLIENKLEKWVASVGTQWLLPLPLSLNPATLVLFVEFK